MAKTAGPLVSPPGDVEEPETPGPYTVEDFYRLAPDGTKADLLHGYIYKAVPDTAQSDALTHLVHFLLQGYADAKDAGRVTGSRFAYRLTERDAPEPDVAFVSKARLGTVERLGGREAPDIAVEVVSRDSRGRDYGRKLRLYERAGVREYWLLDPLRGEVHFYRLQDGKFVEAPGEAGIYRSLALPGFWVRVEWLLADPAPRAFACLQEVLAGPG
jgi:Uma2 family endonuclease